MHPTHEESITRSSAMYTDIDPAWLNFNHKHTQETTMSNKNPFEIRAEMLNIAKEYLDDQHKLNMKFMEKMVEEGQKSVADLQDVYKMYTMEDLLEKAKEMYSFVSTKD
jgi:hypothetical protein